MRGFTRGVLPLCLLLALGGCMSIGPDTIRRDRVSYGDAVDEAAKRELLLNIVKLRYGDSASFVRVNQIVAGYTFESRVNLGSNFLTNENFALGDNLDVGAGATYADRPTITYQPIRGGDYARFLLTPIPPAELLALVLAGTPTDLLLTLGVQAMNGLRNNFDAGLGSAVTDPEFGEALGLLLALGRRGQVGIRFEGSGIGRTPYLIFYRPDDEPLAPEEAHLCALLGLDPGLREFRVVFGLKPRREGEVAFYTRSLIEAMTAVANRIAVPDSDVSEGRTFAPQSDQPSGKEAEKGDKAELPPPRGASDEALPLLTIRSGESHPSSAFIAARYRDRWYWIDDRDLAGKRFFSTLMLLVTISEGNTREGAPVITIPAS